MNMMPIYLELSTQQLCGGIPMVGLGARSPTDFKMGGVEMLVNPVLWRLPMVGLGARSPTDFKIGGLKCFCKKCRGFIFLGLILL